VPGLWSMRVPGSLRGLWSDRVWRMHQCPALLVPAAVAGCECCLVRSRVYHLACCANMTSWICESATLCIPRDATQRNDAVGIGDAMARKHPHTTTMAIWTWQRATYWEQIAELMNLVEPDGNVYDRHGIVDRYPDRYRAYVGHLQKAGDAIAIAAWLPMTKTLHIETFAVHPRCRGAGHARRAWASWRAALADDWPVTCTARDSLTIEVYLHNVEAWRKIMGVTEVHGKDLPAALYLLPSTPVQWMARDLTYPPAQVYAEWQAFQRRWHGDLAARGSHRAKQPLLISPLRSRL